KNFIQLKNMVVLVKLLHSSILLMSPFVPSQIFLMTYISQSVHLNMTDTFNCTVLTPGQRVLLGADWVWAVLDKPTKNPRIQIAVQVLHLPEREGVNVDKPPPEAYSESVQMAHVEAGNKNTSEKLVEFCSSIGKDCYALFLFMGRKNDKENIYGVVSNNFEAATGKCVFALTVFYISICTENRTYTVCTNNNR
uniref:Uncharacterized protein n=1 Tax=Sphaeramia orbicularis TaxID=375764 RepID=A0A672ZZ25_9TELE